MQQQTLIGLYPTRSLAEDVRNRLRTMGIAENDIALGADQGGTASVETAQAPKHEGGFWEWLFGGDVSADERDRYSGHLRGGNVAVSVRVRSDAEHAAVIEVMEQFDPINIDADEGLPPSPRSGIAGVDASQSLERPTAASTSTGGEEVIPLAKEELQVGTRQTERRYRIRTHVIERPVEEQVHLRDERVVIERRPASGAAPVGAEGLQEREFEVIERHEEPIVQKTTRAGEEIVVHREARDRVETVRDTVRETKVDVDQAAAGAKPSLAPAEQGTVAAAATDPLKAPKKL